MYILCNIMYRYFTSAHALYFIVRYERIFGRLTSYNICVTTAMREDLLHKWNVRWIVFFCLLSCCEVWKPENEISITITYFELTVTLLETHHGVYRTLFAGVFLGLMKLLCWPMIERSGEGCSLCYRPFVPNFSRLGTKNTEDKSC